MRASLLCLGLIVLWAEGCASGATAPAPRPTRAPLPAYQAVRAALESLRADSAMGHLAGSPTLIRGQVMPHAKARLILNGRDARRPKFLPERLVWCIVTRGNWVLHIPGAHGDPGHGIPPIPAHDIVVEMYAGVILDATTGGTLEQGGINPAQETELLALPPLSLNRD